MMEFLETLFIRHLINPRDRKWHGRLHSHSSGEYEIHYFIDGKGKFLVEDRSFPYGPGTLFITPPGVEHQVQYPKQDVSFYAYLFKLSPGKDQDLISYIEKTGNKPGGFKVGANNRYFFETIRSKNEHADPYQVLSARHQFISFIFGLDSHTHGQGAEENPYIEKALKFIQNHLREKIDVGFLAERLGIDKSYFIRLFKKHMGQPPLHFINRLKMDHAARLLRKQEGTFTQIAEELALSSEFHFSRMFKNYTGTSPSEYRSRYQKKPN